MRFRLIQDDSSHWYLIEDGQENDFYDWERWVEAYCPKGYTGPEFDGNRIDGYHRLTFTDPKEDF